MAAHRSIQRFARATRLTIISCLALIVAAGAASATDLPLEGRVGIEAVPFRADCPTGYYLVGINGRAGSWVDAVQTVCAPWYADAGIFGNKTFGIHFGGQGGGETSAVCPFNSAVGGWGVEVMSKGKRYVEEIQVTCRATAGGKLHVAIVQFGGANQNPYSGTSSFRCREGELATGIHGRASAYIEAIGLICGPEPQVLEGPTTSTPESSAPPPDRDLGIVTNVPGAKASEVFRKPDRDIYSNRPGTGVTDTVRNPDAEVVTQAPGADATSVILRPGAACVPGHVWRVIRPDDLVCVTPRARALAAQENDEASDHVDPDGAFGPNTCTSGFVWRNAFAGDLVCVTPSARDRIATENRRGPSRVVED